MQKARIPLIIAGTIAALMLSSCSGINKQKMDPEINNLDNSVSQTGYVIDSGPEKGGVLNLFSTKPDTMNPILSKNAYVQKFSRLIFESMVTIGRNQEPVPALADKWECSSDGLVWEFHIREGVKWHDGRVLTPEDVKFTVETIQNPAVSSIYKTNVDNIAAIVAAENNIARIILKKPNAFTPMLMTFPIIQKHQHEGKSLVQKDSTNNMQPLGTGPYRIVKSGNENIIKLAAFADWWQSKTYETADGQTAQEDAEAPIPPYIPEVNIKIYSSPGDAFNAFQEEEVDIGFIENGDFSKYSGNTTITLRKFVGREYECIAFNLESPLAGLKEVRKAISLAIDKVAVIDDCVEGEAVPAEMPYIPGGWVEKGEDYVLQPPDVSNAKQLLETNGWEMRKGIYEKRIKGERTPLKLEMLVNDMNQDRLKIAEKLSEQLSEIGIQLDIKKVSWEEQLKLMGERKFDMALVGYHIPVVPDFSFMYHSSEIPTGRNVAGYSSSQADSLLSQITSENDRTRQQKLYEDLKSLIRNDNPYIGLFFRNNGVLYNKRLKGQQTPYVWDIFSDFTRWYIPLS